MKVGLVELVSVRDGRIEKEVVFLRQNAGGKLREFLRNEDGDNIVVSHVPKTVIEDTDSFTVIP